MNQKKYYKVLSVENTKAVELERYGEFQEDYHKKYIDKTGYVIGHYVSDNNLFRRFKCIVVEVDEQGRPKDADWFHEDDLMEVDMEG